MVKPEWGTKRACPKCGVRFYDLTKDEPVVCIACAYSWDPEPILKSKQPLPFEQVKAAAKPVKEDSDDDEDLEVVDDEEPSADDDVDLGGDDDLGVETGKKDDEN